MNILYALEEIDQAGLSLFLAGPSPRNKTGYNWRVEALDMLDGLGFTGTVFVPLPRKGGWSDDRNAQDEWEWKYLEAANAIAFWVPRDLETLPGFTTNIEFGLYAKSGKIISGYPESAPKMRYLHHLAKRHGIEIYNDLRDTLSASARLAQAKFRRKNPR